MKKILLLLLFFCNSLYSQSFSHYQPSSSQLDFFKSNPKELKNEEGKSLFNSNDFDTLSLNGDSISNNYGYSVSSAGDVNGDGFSDIIVGYNINNYPYEQWRALIFYGGLEVDNIADITLTGNIRSFIFSVSTAGDVTGDGFSDVIVGTLDKMVYVFYGGISMDTTYDFSFFVNNNALEYQYYSVSTAGDVNGDGYSDVFIGLGSWNGSIFSGPGELYIFYGGIVLDNIVDVNIDVNYLKEISVSTAGDINGDGFSDVIAGSSSTNKAYIYYGSEAMDFIADVMLTGEPLGFGWTVSTAGDVNGDGYSDVIVGASYRFSNNDIGKGYIFLGGATMNNVVDIILNGGEEDYLFSYSVSTAGDINDDGFSDIIIGAYGYNSRTGRSYIYYGGSPMDNTVDAIFTGQSENCDFGKSVSSAGDVNGDGFSDVIIGAPGYNNNSGLVNVYLKEPFIKIKLKVIMEGMYYPLFNLIARKDSITTYLRNSTPPYNIIDSARAIIDSLSLLGLFEFFNSPTGNYYISVKHFNSIETWSKPGGENLALNSSIYNYDFTTTITQSYGNNMKLKGGKYCLYSGDVNQDGYITLFDVIPIYNDASNFVSGRFLATDLTGDSIVDLTDVTLCYNNSANFIRVRKP